jgi:hypothetical protein
LRVPDLRHTAVALWIAAGASPKEVARRAGHTSVKTVLDVYGHLYDEDDVALRERLEAMFVPGRRCSSNGLMRPQCVPSQGDTPAERSDRARQPGRTCQQGEWACRDLNL